MTIAFSCFSVLILLAALLVVRVLLTEDRR